MSSANLKQVEPRLRSTLTSRWNLRLGSDCSFKQAGVNVRPEIGTRYTFSHQLVMCPPADDLLGVNLHIYYIYSLSLSDRRGGAQRWGKISQDRPLKQMATSHSLNLAIAEERGDDTHPIGPRLL